MALEFNIRLFTRLEQLAKDNGVSDVDWCRAAWPESKSNPGARVTELRKIVQIMREQGVSQHEAQRIAKRKFTFNKAFHLIKGILQLLPTEEVYRVIDEEAAEEKEAIRRILSELAMLRAPDLEMLYQILLSVRLRRQNAPKSDS